MNALGIVRICNPDSYSILQSQSLLYHYHYHLLCSVHYPVRNLLLFEPLLQDPGADGQTLDLLASSS